MIRTQFISIALLLLLSTPALALELQGELTQGGFITGKINEPKTQIFLDEQELPITADGYFVFGFGRDHKEQARLKTLYPDGHTETKTLTITPREYKIQRIDGIDSKMVNPPQSTWDRIAADRTLVANARRHNTEIPYFLTGFTPPADGEISGVYGSQRILNGTPKQPHYGIDYAAPEGAPVIAPADGIVRLAHKDLYYTGGTVIIDHGHDLSSTLMHLSKINVKEGQKVKQGDLVGAVGATGRATGPHLDWRMNWRTERIDPALVLKLSE